ncbi:sec1 family domain-containing protein 2 [Pitangus sulphuratus]|nr:sec1 family domain-containing protein 2 [Pitangus sulphuratus]
MRRNEGSLKLVPDWIFNSSGPLGSQSGSTTALRCGDWKQTLGPSLLWCSSRYTLFCQKAELNTAQHTKAYTPVMLDNEMMWPEKHMVRASYKPLLKQVVEEICNPDRLDPVDIEHMSSGLTDLLKTGFSMFMKVNRPHPGDHPLLIIFMVGGVSVSEVKMVKDLVATRKPGTQVIVLSSALLTPHSAVDLLFAPDHLQPDTDI